MPIRKKLTASLREKIKNNPRGFKKKDLSGEALTYLNRVRGAAKARKIKKDTTVKINKRKLDKKSDAYRIIAAAAKNVGLTPAEFIKRNPKSIDAFLDNSKFYVNEEMDIVKKNIDAMTGDVHQKNKKTTKSRAKYYITRIRNKLINDAPVYDKILLEYYMSASGDAFIDVPFPNEYSSIHFWEDLLFFIDSNYPQISYYVDPKRIAEFT